MNGYRGYGEIYIYIYAHTHTHTHTHKGMQLSHEKNEVIPFATTWMDLQIIMLSEVRQRKINAIWYHLHVESKKCYKATYLQNRNRLSENKLTFFA